MLRDRPWIRWLAFGIGAAVLLAFGVSQFHAALLMTDPRIHGDLGDGRFVGIILEHGYRWTFTDWPQSLFAAPWNVYPFAASFGFAENMYGNLPLYAPWRLLGFEMESAHQLWFVATSAMNFACALWLLLRLGGGPIVALAGAFVFAFGMPRGAQMGHAQMMPHYLTPLAFGCLLLYVEGLVANHRRRGIFLILAAACTAGQIWQSVYFGWYLGLTFLMTGVLALVIPSWRSVVWQALRQDYLWIGAAAGLAVGMLVPVAMLYGAVSDNLGGGHDWGELMIYTPRAGCWVQMRPGNWIYDPSEWQWLNLKLGRCGTAVHEKYLFAGFTPWIITWAGLGLWLATIRKLPRHRLAVSGILAVALITVWALLTTNMGKGIVGWWLLFEYVPGGDAVRVPGRVVILLLLFYGVALVWLSHELIKRWGHVGRGLAWALAIFFVIENIHTNTWGWSIAAHRQRVASLVAQARDAKAAGSCEAFIVPSSAPNDWRTQLDAMWTSMQAELPTLNGYGSKLPAEWLPASKGDPAGVRAWLEHAGRPDAEVCRFQR